MITMQMPGVPPEVTAWVQTIFPPVSTALVIWLVYIATDLKKRVERLERFFFDDDRGKRVIKHHHKRRTDTVEETGT